MKILSHLESIADPRRAQGQRYQLKYVLLFTVFAMLSNAKSYRNIEAFINACLKKLNKAFKIEWKRSPDYTQIRNIIIAIEKESMEKAFRMYSKELSEAPVGNKKCRMYIAFDGKALRGSIDHFQDKKCLQELFAYEINGKIILGHIDIDEKSNEIHAVQEIIQKLNLHDCVFTADAMHCQKKH